MVFHERHAIGIVAGLALILVAGVADAAQLSREAATAKAVALLKGNPYGKTSAEVRGNMIGISLLEKGKSPCGTIETPQWYFHISVPKPTSDPPNPINGHLTLDAVTGKVICALGLPFMD